MKPKVSFSERDFGKKYIKKNGLPNDPKKTSETLSAGYLYNKYIK